MRPALRKLGLTGLHRLDNQSGLNRKILNMLKHTFWRTMIATILTLAITACGGGTGSSAPAPTGFTVTPGNGQAIVTWDASPGVQYWLMYAATASQIDIKNPPSSHAWATNISPPFVLSGLLNGVTYSFAMNARTDGGKGGEQTASKSVTPGYAGTNWIAGTTTLGSSEMRAIAFGLANSASTYVAVGTGGAIFQGPEGASQSVAGMGWTAVTPATPLTTNFKAATYAFSKYIAIGSDAGVSNIVSSADLTNWTAATWTPAGANLNALANNGTTLVAVGNGGVAFSTTDGVTWNSVATGVLSDLYGLTYSPTGLWVAVGAGGTVITSPDLATWTPRTSNAGGNDLNGVTVNISGVLVAVGNNGTKIRSTDGQTWVAQTPPSSAHLYAVSTDSAQFLAVGAAGTVFTSLDGSTWNTISQTSTAADLMAIVGSTSKYVVVGKSGANISSIH